MTTLYLATGDAVAIIRRHGDTWTARVALAGQPTQCVAADPRRPARVYCATFGRGLWLSDDAGATWQPAGAGLAYAEVTAVAVGVDGTVWAGTEPSALFRSDDAGRTWRECTAMRELPSAPTWRFPPRPWTSHVRTIAPDPHVAGRLFVGIELGGVLRSLDGGETWQDRHPDAQPDAHFLLTHPRAAGRVYEAAGGGYAETRDGGETWRRDDAGLPWRYLWGLAVDPIDPDTLVVSASPGPAEAHGRPAAQAALFRRTASGPWQPAQSGLPAPRGTRAYLLASDPIASGVFYAVPKGGGLYRSTDAGTSWQPLDVHWPNGYRPSDATWLTAVELD
jgi:photosystem II stability/assembly factor-like uncharacterized protein